MSKIKYIKDQDIYYINNKVEKDFKNPGDDNIHLFMEMDNIYLFEAYSTGDFEESCFAVTPETYEFVTNCKPYIEILGEEELISENPFYKGMISLYVYEMVENPMFKDIENELQQLLKKEGKVMLFLNKRV